jgi:hypothetical protein
MFVPFDTTEPTFKTVTYNSLRIQGSVSTPEEYRSVVVGGRDAVALSNTDVGRPRQCFTGHVTGVVDDNPVVFRVSDGEVVRRSSIEHRDNEGAVQGVYGHDMSVRVPRDVFLRVSSLYSR